MSDYCSLQMIIVNWFSFMREGKRNLWMVLGQHLLVTCISIFIMTSFIVQSSYLSQSAEIIFFNKFKNIQEYYLLTTYVSIFLPYYSICCIFIAVLKLYTDDVDPSSVAGRIVECSWNKEEQCWACMRIRSDKSTPNDINTYRKASSYILSIVLHLLIYFLLRILLYVNLILIFA